MSHHRGGSRWLNARDVDVVHVHGLLRTQLYEAHHARVLDPEAGTRGSAWVGWGWGGGGRCRNTFSNVCKFVPRHGRGGGARSYEIRLADFDTAFCCSRIDGCPTKLLGCQKNLDPELATLATKLQFSMVTHAFARWPDGSRPLVLRDAALRFMEEGGGRSLTGLLEFLGGTAARRGPLSTLSHYHACAAGRGDWTVETYLAELGAGESFAPGVSTPPTGLTEALTCSYHADSYF
ncbi:hypothetical protein AB1Y20_008548 [Prymnesium parvum]|uniref:Uncharacterized protein n=1 Tax=Prymnesium parvum TaxID=97485 RepID=A0AB34IU96_PRYPA